MSMGITGNDPVAITLHDTVAQTQKNVIGVQATTGGIIKIVNKAGATIDVPIADNQILPISIFGRVMKSTGSTATSLIAWIE